MSKKLKAVLSFALALVLVMSLGVSAFADSSNAETEKEKEPEIVQIAFNLGTMEPCIYFIGEQYGLKYSNSAFSGIMIAVVPIVTLIFAAIFLKERPSRAQWLFSALSIKERQAALSGKLNAGTDGTATKTPVPTLDERSSFAPRI